MAERSKRGFASMDREKQRQIASKGGKAAHAKGTAHEFTREEAIEAGRKGGKAAHAKGTAHRFSSEEAGQVGGRTEQHHSPAPQPAAMAGGGSEGPMSSTRSEPTLA
jgi:general stress protein YciG